MNQTILYVVSNLGRTGPTNQLFNIVTNLDQSEFSPTILTLSPEGPASRIEDFANAGVSVQTLGLSRQKGFMQASRKLAAHLVNLCPHVVHSQGIRADGLLAGLRDRPKWVATVRNQAQDDYPMKFGRVLGTAMAAYHLRALRRCDHLVACSDSVRSYLSSRGIQSTTIRNGVRVDRLPEARMSLDFPSPVIVTVGSLIRRKNLPLLIDAFEDYSRTSVGSLLVLGDGPEMTALRSRAHSDRIHFLGQVVDVRRYLTAADLFVSASLSEGFPNTVLEALEAGVPALISDIGPHRELAEVCGYACRLFDLAATPRDLATMLKDYLDQITLDPSVRHAARESACSHLSAECMSQSYQDLYRSVAG